MNNDIPSNKAPQNQEPKASFPALSESKISTWLLGFAVINFIVAVIGAIRIFGGDREESGLGWILAVLGTSGGFALLAFAKIIDCLHESTYRLRNIQKLLEK